MIGRRLRWMALGHRQPCFLALAPMRVPITEHNHLVIAETRGFLGCPHLTLTYIPPWQSLNSSLTASVSQV
jgi:hypothetical protein